MTKGYVHSYESGAMVDGPGIRFVLFLSGCPLRCQYCHNPDTWDMIKGGKETSVEEVMKQIKSSASFLKSANGGVTISGGEPLFQPEFTTKILKECKKLGLHTAVDTSGFMVKNLTEDILNNTDLFLVDLKSYNPKTYKEVTTVDLQPTLKFLDILQKHNKPIWIRFVLVPGLTDNLEDIEKMAEYVSKLKNLERLDILPFHQMGAFKWKELGLDYKLSNTKSPTQELVQKVKDIFTKHSVNVH